ncbi:N5-carboxyaminoimidazole ribonucleotide mutase [Companilactobacillus sp. RD055328]|uniref:5-(carboxyamino)imidazole ribonucleotide mutase n=1 Tax=Companilactobacillus sp. RD055328 TaxID=2916634 RepID=UPI00208568E6|nr:N5-carboxyaminoimidazole ribonucleotide mutase [Companilactobacillus sp. RD055328]
MDVAIVMGSISDLDVMKHAKETLEKLGVAYETRIISAHRMPNELSNFSKKAEENGIKVIIAGAGGAAHLPGMLAANTNLPVIGVPMMTKTLNGIDSLLSIVQMPAGVPVGTVAIGKPGAINAAIYATQICALNNNEYKNRLSEFKKEMHDMAVNSNDELS